MLYASLRILFTAERHAAAVLLTLLCLFGIYEAWTGIRQIYGFAYSNHGLFKVTGTLFNPGPYAGFIAPVLVCAVACIVRSNHLAGRLLRRQTLRRPRSLLRPCVLTGGLLPCLAGWGAALLGAVVLPASMSRAALAAVAAGCGALAPGNSMPRAVSAASSPHTPSARESPQAPRCCCSEVRPPEPITSNALRPRDGC